MDESREGFKAQREYVRQRRAEDEARFKAIEEMVQQQYAAKRDSSAEKNIQVGEDKGIKLLKMKEDEEDEQAATGLSDKAAAYKEMLKKYQ